MRRPPLPRPLPALVAAVDQGFESIAYSCLLKRYPPLVKWMVRHFNANQDPESRLDATIWTLVKNWEDACNDWKRHCDARLLILHTLVLLAQRTGVAANINI